MREFRLPNGETVDKDAAIGVLAALTRLRDAGNMRALHAIAALPGEHERQAIPEDLEYAPETLRQFLPERLERFPSPWLVIEDDVKKTLKEACLTTDWHEGDNVHDSGDPYLLEEVAKVARAVLEIDPEKPYAVKFNPRIEQALTARSGYIDM